MRVGDYGGTAGPEDAGLFAPDLLARRAEILHVVDTDARQHGAVGVDDVHRVEPAAQADLEDGRFDFFSGEVVKRRKRAEFEVRQLNLTPRPLHGSKRVGERLVRRLDPGDPDALVVAQEMRRRVEAGAISGGAQDRLEHRAGRSLAVGSRDGDHGAIDLDLQP